METAIGGFGKHYASMYQGSMIGAGAVVFAVMGYVIANQVPDAEMRMVVELNPKLLGFILGEAESAVAGAIEFLCAADCGSRTKAQEGSRLVRQGEFLYWVVNGQKYRKMQDPARRREQNREAKRRERAKKNGSVSQAYKVVEAAFVKADGDGDLKKADAIAARGLKAVSPFDEEEE